MESGKRGVGPVTTAAAAGGTVGGAVAVLVLYVVESLWGELPGAVAGALQLVVTTLFTLIGGFIVKPDSKGKHSE